MPITPYLGDGYVDPETRRIMGVAFEMVCAALRVDGPDDKLRPVIAGKIIELVQAGERDANVLSDGALTHLRNGP